ncbi:hypothetical protein LCGC14_0447920 [marine sediment metagenome]|uniref:Uncharacterized protein n=1 Tax=marine sediment metagenome TaxID=412755 RepID=A0A0F9T1Y3_9ZZZZ
MADSEWVKTCTKCGILQLVSEFHKKPKGKYGLNSRCKTCVKNYDQKRYQVYKVEENKRCKKYHQTIIGCLHNRFINIKQRCNDPKIKSYKNYGGRGIKCLFKSFNEFADHVINELKVDPRDLTVDRINNDGHYEPGNIRFVTQAENNRNKRKHAK